MTTVPMRNLRNHTASVVERVRAGEAVILTAGGERIARVEPLNSHRRPFLAPAEVLTILRADAALRADLVALGDSTEALGPIE